MGKVAKLYNNHPVSCCNAVGTFVKGFFYTKRPQTELKKPTVLFGNGVYLLKFNGQYNSIVINHSILIY